MMKLYFFRHGHAEDAQLPDFDDFTRKLTDKGEERTTTAAQALLKLDVRLARLYTSPRVRSRQTADIMGRIMGVTVTVREEVGFGFNPEVVESLIAGLDFQSEVMFVGHEPDLSQTIATLIGGGELLLKKGGMARVDLMEGLPLRGALVWLLAPRLFEIM